ncbi:MAG: FecR family protein [Paludibacter sp.]|nr:FecR family protein [Paludibacter sp.]
MLDKSHQFEKLMMNHLSGTISDSEEGVFLDILNSDPKYKTLYNEMVKTRAISQIPLIESKRASNYKLLLKFLNNELSVNFQHSFWQYFSRVAAIIIFVLSTSVSTYYIYTSYNNSSNKLMSYQTVVPLGSQAKIVLPDGTVAWLNSGSTLKYNNLYGKTNRDVLLTGEAYFDVKKDKSKPFLVHTNDIQIKVLGTVFNVRSYNDNPTVEVNLLKGKVDVSMINNENIGKLTLLPNQEMIYTKKSKTMKSFAADVSKSALWRTGKLCFMDASVEDIAKDLERKYDVHIIFQSDKIKNEYYSGSLNLNLPINTLLEYIDVDRKFTRTYNGKTITIKNK